MTQTPPNPEQLAQQLIMSVQALEEEIARGQNNLQMIEVQMQRLAETTTAVQELKNHKVGDEIMVNIGSGVHLYVKLIDPKHVVTSFGAGLAAERTVDQALNRFEEQQKQLTDIAQRQQEQIQNTQSRIEEYRSQLNQLIESTQQQSQKTD
ncbi:MAG: prefoldin subunit alpha [Candidatus Thorarchaeota archaeon]